jgi:hypothetical protein
VAKQNLTVTPELPSFCPEDPTSELDNRNEVIVGFGGGIISPLSPPIRGSKSKDSHRAKLVRHAVESVGSRVLDDVVRDGEKAFIKCDAHSDVEDRLRRRIIASGIRNNIKFHRYGPKLLFIQFRDFSKAPRTKMPEDRVSKIGDMVKRVHEEMKELREHMLRKKFTDRLDAATREEHDSLIRQELKELKAKHPKFLIFDAVQKDQQLRTRLMEHLPRSRQFVALAKEFSAVLLAETSSTVNEAWYQFGK